MVLKIKTGVKKRIPLNISDWLVLLFFMFGIGRPTWNGYRIILLILGTGWLLMVLPSLIKLKYFADKAVLSYFIFLILYMLFSITSRDLSLTFSYFGTYFLYFIILLMYSHYEYNKKIDKLELIAKVLIIWICMLCVFSIIYYNAHPGAARLYATHRADLGWFMIGGGYQLAYLCAMLLPIFTGSFFYGDVKRKYIIISVLMILLVYETTSVITMVIALIGCFLSFVFSGKKKRKVISFIILLIVIGLFFVTKEYIGDFLIKIGRGRVVTSYADMNNATYVRMTEIGYMLKGIQLGAGSAFGLRITNYMRPLKSIIEHPLTGSIFITGVCPQLANFNDSTIITAFVCWGIPMGFLNIYPIVNKIKKYKSYMGSAVVIILTLLLNPSDGFSVYTGGFFLVPAIHMIKEHIRTREVKGRKI